MLVEMVELVLEDRRRPLHLDSGLLSSSLLSSSHTEDMGGPGRVDCDVRWEATDSVGLCCRAVGAFIDCCEEALEMETSGCVFIGDQPSIASGVGVPGAVVEIGSTAAGMRESYR